MHTDLKQFNTSSFASTDELKINFMCKTRMHSSRMRTGRALTVSGGGGWCIPEEILGKKNLKKKKKNWRPPQKLETTPRKLEYPPPPRKIGEPPQIGDPPPGTRPPPPGTRSPPPGTRSPPVDRQTLVKILPWPNFVAAGNQSCLDIFP